MKWMLILLVFVFTPSVTQCQELLEGTLTKVDSRNGIIHKYEFDCPDSYCEIRLVLFKDYTYTYSLKTFNRDVFSNGKWSRKKDTLIIKSFIQKDNVPVKLTYSNDTAGRINSFKVAIVRNKKGQLMTDGLVKINCDSILCLPMMGGCIGRYESIDSLKIVFENGMSSKWLKIGAKDFNKVTPIVQTDFLISSYDPLNRRYKILKSSISIIDINE